MNCLTKAPANPKFGPHLPWKCVGVLWVTRDGVLHVASHAATMRGGGVVSKCLCGGATTLWPEACTWYGMKGRGGKFCRKCIARLAASVKE